MMYDVEFSSSNSPLFFTTTQPLGQKTTNQVTIHSLNPTNDTLFVETSTNGGSLANTLYYRVFLSTQSGVSTAQYQGYTEVYLSRNTVGTLSLSAVELESYGFSSGQTIYVKSVAESFYPNDYFNPNIGYKVFPNANETGAAELSFTML